MYRCRWPVGRKVWLTDELYIVTALKIEYSESLYRIMQFVDGGHHPETVSLAEDATLA